MAFTVKAIRGLLELEDRWTTKLTEAAAKTTAFTATMEKKLDDVGGKFTKGGAALTAGITVPLVAIAGLSLKAAIDFESSFAGVRKTLDMTGVAAGDTETVFGEMRQEIRNLAKEMPLSVNEINKVAEAAGQLGVKRGDVISFTETMIKLGTATNLTADEAATSFARFGNIMGEPTENVGKLGSALVALGNDGASTESEIMSMALRIAGAGKTVGMTSAEVLGIANALSSLGIEAEMGGSAVSKIMLRLARDVSAGGAELKQVAEVAGTTGTAFATMFQADPGAAIQAYIGGLGAIKASGGDLIGVLGDLDIKEIRLLDTHLRLANSGDLLKNSMDLGKRSFEENAALQREYAERVKTTQAQLTIFRNKVYDVAITLGEALLPALTRIVDAAKPVLGFVEKLVVGFSNLPTPVQGVVLGLLGLAAAIGPLLMGIGLMSQGVAAILPLWPYLAKALIAVTGPIGLVVAAVIGLGLIWYKWGDDIKRVVSETYNVIKEWVLDKFQGSILQKVVNLLSEMGRAWDAAQKLIGQVVAAIFGAVKTWLLDKLQPAFEWLANVWTYVTGAWETASNAITGFVTGIYNSVKTWLLDKFEWVIGRIGAGIDKVTGWFKKFRESMGDVEVDIPQVPQTTAPAPKPPPVPKPTVVVPPAQLTPPGGLGRNRISDEEKAAVKAQVEALKDIRLAQVALTDSQKAAIAPLLKLGISTGDIAKAYRVSEVAIKNYEQGIENAAKVEEQWADLRKYFADTTRTLQSKATDDFNKDQEERATATGQSLAAQLEAYGDFHEANARIGMSAQQQELRTIEQSRAAEIANLTSRGIIRGKLYDMAVEQINRFYDHEKDIANRTSDTIVERMRAAGVQTRADLEATAVSAEQDYADMLLYSDQFTAQDIENARLRAIASRNATKEVSQDWISTITMLSSSLNQLGSAVGGTFGQMVGGITSVVGAMDAYNKRVEAGIKLTKTQKAMGAIQGAADIWNATGGGQSKGKGALSGAMAGASAGAMFGPWGAAAGAVGGAIVGLIRGTTDYQKRVRAANEEMAKMREEAVKLSGGAEKMSSQFKFLGLDIEQAFKNGDPALVKKMLDEGYGRLADINENLTTLATRGAGAGKTLDASLRPYIEQLKKAGILTEEVSQSLLGMTESNQMSWQDMQSLAEQYGVSLSALGPTFQQQKLTETATDIIQAFERLVGNGADFNGVLAGMTDEINEVVQNSLKFGTEIPGNMQPWIAKLIESGNLVDAAGNKITDINTLKFGPDVKDDVQLLTDAIKDLVKTMTQNLGGAIDGLNRRSVRIPVRYEVETEVPEGAPDVVAGRNSSNGKPVHITMNVDGRTVTRAVLPYLPEEVELSTA